jgi:hypothetical protein
VESPIFLVFFKLSSLVGMYGLQILHSQKSLKLHHSFDMVHNISVTTKLGTVNSHFYRFLRLCSFKVFFISQKVSLIVLLESKGYPLKIFLKSRASPIKRTLFLEFEDLEFSE